MALSRPAFATSVVPVVGVHSVCAPTQPAQAPAATSRSWPHPRRRNGTPRAVCRPQRRCVQPAPHPRALWGSMLTRSEKHMCRAPLCIQAEHRDKISGANSVTKEFLIFSQPYIDEGALLSSSVSGRRLYVHHLADVPVSEVFTTREGNHLQRVDKVRADMSPPSHRL